VLLTDSSNNSGLPGRERLVRRSVAASLTERSPSRGFFASSLLRVRNRGRDVAPSTFSGARHNRTPGSGGRMIS
jgi:hypothetical protein